MLTYSLQEFGHLNQVRANRKPAFARVASTWVGIMVLGSALLGRNQFEAAAQSAYNSVSPPPGQEWSFDVVPYLWLAFYDGNFGVPNSPVGGSGIRTDSSFATHISAAAMLAAHIRYREFGLLIDGAWAQLKTEGGDPSGLYSGVDLKSDFAYGTGALSYRLAPMGKLQTDLFAGARVWHVHNELDFRSGAAPAASAEGTRTWADPILGAKLSYEFNKRWYATVLGDAGGFGAGSDLTWSVFGGVGYRFSDLFSATLGYRYMHLDYAKDNFKMDANIQGFLLGLGFHF